MEDTVCRASARQCTQDALEELESLQSMLAKYEAEKANKPTAQQNETSSVDAALKAAADAYQSLKNLIGGYF